MSAFGLFFHAKAAAVFAAPWSFIKMPLRSLYYEQTIVEQLQYKGAPITYYGGQEKDSNLKRLGVPNLSCFALEEARKHQRYGKQKWFILAHDGEWTDHVATEKGEITYGGASGVENNKTDIVDIWETPYVHHIGLHVYPIHILSKGGGKKDYDKWIKGELQKIDEKERGMIRPLVKL